MLELSHSNINKNAVAHSIDVSINFGGDTLNTAIYASRLGMDSYYFTALGDDFYSKWLLYAWQQEGINTHYVKQCSGKLPGLYAIELYEKGERAFHYWRKDSAASGYLNAVGAKQLFEQLMSLDLVYLSGISLGILDDAQKTVLIDVISKVHSKGKIVAFDGNYRPRNWESQTQAQHFISAILKHVNWYLPTLDDESLLFNTNTFEEVIAHYQYHNFDELIIKDGANGCYVLSQEYGNKSHNVPIPRLVTPIDTTAAGDSFNAGFIAARMKGQNAINAALAGHNVAAKVIGHKGAIIPKTYF